MVSSSVLRPTRSFGTTDASPDPFHLDAGWAYPFSLDRGRHDDQVVVLILDQAVALVACEVKVKLLTSSETERARSGATGEVGAHRSPVGNRARTPKVGACFRSEPFACSQWSREGAVRAGSAASSCPAGRRGPAWATASRACGGGGSTSGRKQIGDRRCRGSVAYQPRDGWNRVYLADGCEFVYEVSRWGIPESCVGHFEVGHRRCHHDIGPELFLFPFRDTAKWVPRSRNWPLRRACLTLLTAVLRHMRHAKRQRQQAAPQPLELQPQAWALCHAMLRHSMLALHRCSSQSRGVQSFERHFERRWCVKGVERCRGCVVCIEFIEYARAQGAGRRRRAGPGVCHRVTHVSVVSVKYFLQ